MASRPGRCAQSGWTLLELTIVITVIGIISSYAVPHFGRAIERSHGDMARARLETIWTAERLHWISAKRFSGDLDLLRQENLLGMETFASLSGDCKSCLFNYAIVEADEHSFVAVARRINSTRWIGDLQIDEQGRITGEIRNRGDNYVIGY